MSEQQEDFREVFAHWRHAQEQLQSPGQLKRLAQFETVFRDVHDIATVRAMRRELEEMDDDELRSAVERYVCEALSRATRSDLLLLCDAVCARVAQRIVRESV